jgi:protein involved in polysaccharide export with SLBB domain
MLHALSMAGGINELGSYRNINLVRSGKIIDTLDIYEVLVYGKYNFANGLRSGDSIVVNPYNKLISVESGVMRPGVYELKENESFKELLGFVNGFSKQNDYENITIKRVVRGKNTELRLTLDELYSHNFVDNDSLYIRQFKLNQVTIEGAVKNPGKYYFSKGTTLSEAIASAGGYESSAYPFGGYLSNVNALKINKEAKERLHQVFISNLITNGTPSQENSSLETLVLQLKNTEPTGRIIAEFDTDVISNDRSLDTLLEDGDRLMVPYITQQVYIHGEVANPGAIRYSPGKGINYYIEKSGGSLENSDMNNLFIVHPNGETDNFRTRSTLSFVIAENDKKLIYPGSIIYVPQNSDFTNNLQIASIWAPIISSIALSLTSLSVLNNTN